MRMEEVRRDIVAYLSANVTSSYVTKINKRMLEQYNSFGIKGTDVAMLYKNRKLAQKPGPRLGFWDPGTRVLDYPLHCFPG